MKKQNRCSHWTSCCLRSSDRRICCWTRKRYETKTKRLKLTSNNKSLATMIKAGTLSNRVVALLPTSKASRLHSLRIIHLYTGIGTTHHMLRFHERPDQPHVYNYDVKIEDKGKILMSPPLHANIRSLTDEIQIV